MEMVPVTFDWILSWSWLVTSRFEISSLNSGFRRYIENIAVKIRFAVISEISPLNDSLIGSTGDYMNRVEPGSGSISPLECTFADILKIPLINWSISLI
ncbi:hypothetical protein FZD05_04555 [Rossellomorea aquimaris]|nr:hypothetical protein FZD05_04555 [Rossellomorea aquimaris]